MQYVAKYRVYHCLQRVVHIATVLLCVQRRPITKILKAYSKTYLGHFLAALQPVTQIRRSCPHCAIT